MDEKDYIAQLFHVRRERFGISDDIKWGWLDPKTNHLTWKSWRHADTDGVGGFANILRPLGFPCEPLPKSSEHRVPSWLNIISASRKNPRPTAPKKMHWKHTYTFHPEKLHTPEVAYLTHEETNALKAKAATENLTTGSIVFSALNRVIAQRLVKSNTPIHWFMGVNVRGATKIKNEQFNQASGINLLTYSNSDPIYWQQQVRLALKAKNHWAIWKLANIGKYIGDTGLSWVYHASSKNSFFAGSCSNMGEWPLPDERNPTITDNRLLCAVGPGTPNYPINSSLIIWNGSATLTLKLHPFICQDQSLIRELTDAWREEVKLYLQSSNAVPSLPTTV